MKTTKEVAAILGISVRRVRQLAKARKVGYHKLDHSLVFSDSDLKLLERRLPGRPSSQTSDLTEAQFKSLLATAAQPRRSQPPEKGEKGRSAESPSDGYTDSRTRPDSGKDT